MRILYIFIVILQQKQLSRMKDEQRREHERKMVELREASRRMKEDCEHQVEIERYRVKICKDRKYVLISNFDMCMIAI